MRTLRNLWLVRVVTVFAALCLLWLQVGPAWAGTAHQERVNREQARRRAEAAQRASGLPPGLTQTLSPAQRRQVKTAETIPETVAAVRTLSKAEMQAARGRGPFRNPYYAGSPMPWHRAFHDVNLCNGNLFKSFTDIQVAPARGAGLVLQRTYNSNDARVGPFGIGWTHAYDIRVQEAADVQAEAGNSSAVPIQTASDATPAENKTINEVPRTDFFGAKHAYHRDADGLYSPPPYLYDEMSSDYDTFLVNGPTKVMDDTEEGMDGTVKHYVNVVTLADGTEGNERACDYIQDRHGNRTALAYGLSYVQPDGSTRKLLTQVTDPSGRSLTFTWVNFGTQSQPAYRITEVDAPTDPNTGAPVYRVTYAYYGANDPAAGGAAYQLKSVTLDPNGLNRTTTYTYTSVTSQYVDQSGHTQTATEYGLLASVADPLAHMVSYSYTIPPVVASGNSLNTVSVSRIVEPAGVDANNSPRAQTWTFDWYVVVSPQETEVHVDAYNDLSLGVSSMFRHPMSAGYFGEPVYCQEWLTNYSPADCSDGGCTGQGVGYITDYDSGGDAVDYYDYWDVNLGYMPPAPPNPYVQSTNRVGYSTYGPHGNMLTRAVDGYPGRETATYYDASKYFQKANVTDMNGHVSALDYYDDQDPSPGNRGEVKLVQDAGYADPSSPSYQKQYASTYNQYGQKLTETNLNGVVTQYAYGTSGDDLGNLVQVVQDPGGAGHLNRTTTMHYDVMGRVVQSVDPKGQESDFAYNTLGQPSTVTVKDATGATQETISYLYDANGRTHSVTDGRGATVMAYEAGCDRVHSVTDPQTGATGYTYTLSGERQTMTLPGGGTWTYTYTNTSDTTKPLTFCLPKDDPNSVCLRLESVTDDQGRQVTYNIDPVGRLESVLSDQTYTTGASPSLVSYCATVFYYDYAYSTVVGHIGVTHDWITQAKTTWYGKNGQGQPISRLLSQNDYTYDGIGQRRTNKVSSQPLDGSGSPQVDGNGNPVLTSRTEAYTYDDVSRLSTVDYGDGQTQSYTFDAMGNRLQRADSASGTTAYTYDAANRLLTAGGQTYASDADGNTITGGGRTNAWDAQNRLVQSVDNGTTCAYAYGADGLRRSATVTPSGGSATTTYYVYDGSTLVREMQRNAQGQLVPTATYLQGARGPEYRRDDNAGTVRWYVYDGLGSVVGEVDPSGNLTASAKFDVYGAKRSGGTGTASSRQGFAGQLGHVTDAETGLVYMRARYYDPGIGRFVSEDPGRQSENWFAYCNNDPVNFVDQNGRSFKQLCQVALAIAVILDFCEITAPVILETITALLNIAKGCFSAAEVLFAASKCVYLMPDAMDEQEQMELSQAQSSFAVGIMASTTIGFTVALYTLAVVGLIYTIDDHI